jgi:hypothetical protein
MSFVEGGNLSSFAMPTRQRHAFVGYEVDADDDGVARDLARVGMSHKPKALVLVQQSPPTH